MSIQSTVPLGEVAAALPLRHRLTAIALTVLYRVELFLTCDKLRETAIYSRRKSNGLRKLVFEPVLYANLASRVYKSI